MEKEKLPFKDNTFDVVTILEVLEHLHDHGLIISEIYRVLKPEGICLMSSPVDSKIYQLVSKHYRYFQEIEYELCDFSPHINVHSRNFWIREFKKCGFELLEDFKRSQKDIILHVINSHEPRDTFARILVKFGKIGRELRLRLAYHLWSTTLIFVKR